MTIDMKKIGFVLALTFISSPSWAYRQQDQQPEEIHRPGWAQEDWRRDEPEGRFPGSYRPDRSHRPSPLPPQQIPMTPRTVIIREAFRDQEILLGRMISLRDWAGYDLNYVSVRLRNPMPRRQSFDLIVNRQLVQNRIPSRGYTDINFALAERNTVGRDIRQLSLGINGYAEIESITFYFSPGQR